MERLHQPIAHGVVPHQVCPTGVGCHRMIAGNQHIDHTRQPLVIAPLHTGLAYQPINDAESRVKQTSEIGQHIGHTHQMMVVVTWFVVRHLGHQPKEVLQCEGDTHESMVLHLLDVH